MAYSKSDITIGHHTHGPEINVKCYHFGDEPDAEGRSGMYRLAAEFNLSEARAEALMGRAWDWLVADFWERAEEDANEILGPAFIPSYVQRRLTVYGEGRSGGWLVVKFAAQGGRQGPMNALPEVETWDAIKVSAWGRFEAAIREEMKYFASYDAIKETLEANDLLEPDAERNEKKRKAERILADTGFVVVDERES